MILRPLRKFLCFNSASVGDFFGGHFICKESAMWNGCSLMNESAEGSDSALWAVVRPRMKHVVCDGAPNLCCTGPASLSHMTYPPPSSHVKPYSVCLQSHLILTPMTERKELMAHGMGFGQVAILMTLQITQNSN